MIKNVSLTGFGQHYIIVVLSLFAKNEKIINRTTTSLKYD